MKTKTYFQLPALLLTASFFGISPVANADYTPSPKLVKTLYTLCTQGDNREACALYYELLIPKLNVPRPPCELVDCGGPFFDKFQTDPNLFRDNLVDFVDTLDQEIIKLDKLLR